MGIQIIELLGQPEPAPRTYVVEKFIPEEAVSILYGDGGVGKSNFALYIATCVAAGHDVLDLRVHRGTVLYIDAELDQREFIRRAYSIARGLALPQPPPGVSYVRLTGSLRNPSYMAELTEKIAERQPRLVVLDSMMAAGAGLDLEKASEATEFMTTIERWGTVLVLDHVAKPQPGSGTSHLRPYGSTFKHNLARSTMYVSATADGFTLEQRKHNFGLMTPRFGVEVVHTTSEVRFRKMHQAQAAKLTLDQEIAAYLTMNGPSTSSELAIALLKPPGTVRNHLTTMKTEGKVISLTGGKWNAASKSDFGSPTLRMSFVSLSTYPTHRGFRRVH